jgi:serine protease Do
VRGLAVLLGALLVLGGCKKQPNELPGAEGNGLPKGAVLVAPTVSAPPGVAPPPPDDPVVPRIAGAKASAAVSPPLVPLSFAGLARAADPGVVTIISLTEETRPTGRRRVVSEGLGTGFVYDKTGLVLTNNHVVEDATQIKVKFTDGRDPVAANIVGRDKLADVAVIRVDDKNLAPLALGDSDALDVGDWVVAIGNPFGLSHTVSAGILSARGRTREDVKGLDEHGYFNFLQTDAAINQGNSGGPLLNLKGEVVGINAAIRANANGIGFAIPINMVKELLPILLREGKVTRSAIGAEVLAVNGEEASRLKRTDRKGALIKWVLPNGGADRAGLQVDDVILSFDGRVMSDPNQLRWVASLAGVGKVVTVRVQRGDKVFDVRVTLGPLPPLPDE